MWLGDFDFMGARPRVDDIALTLYFTDAQLSLFDPYTGDRIAAYRRIFMDYQAALDTPRSAAICHGAAAAVGICRVGEYTGRGSGARLYRRYGVVPEMGEGHAGERRGLAEAGSGEMMRLMRKMRGEWIAAMVFFIIFSFGMVDKWRGC